MKSSKIKKICFIVNAVLTLLAAGILIWRFGRDNLRISSATSMVIDLTGLFLNCVTLGGCIAEKSVDERTSDTFARFLLTIAATWFCDLSSWAFDLNNHSLVVALSMLANMGYYILNVASVYMFFRYLRLNINLNRKWADVYEKVILGYLIVTFLELIVNVWHPFLFEIVDGVYRRLPFSQVSFILGGLFLASTIMVLGSGGLERISRIAVAGFIVIPFVCTMIQMFQYGFSWVSLGSVVALYMLYVYLYAYQSQRLEEQKVELQKNQTAVMLSQIQPHFLFNSLSTIVALCDLDPKLAKQTTLDFSTYLERNLNAVTELEMIPFEKELEQVKAYLRIEKARFGDYLQVEYKLDAVDFRVPSLTVQPMVENAVKHGIHRKPEGGRVLIATRELDDAYLIVVEDDGVGFDYAEKEGDPGFGIGIKNTAKRLKIMCGGSLHISSDTRGTHVEIRIPKGRVK